MTGNKHYKAGRDKEYRVKWKLESKGYIVTRAAGSHSPFDLIAINKDKREIRFIQCKGKSMPESQVRKLQETYEWIMGHMKVSFEVVQSASDI